jgi:hypothetical protein
VTNIPILVTGYRYGNKSPQPCFTTPKGESAGNGPAKGPQKQPETDQDMSEQTEQKTSNNPQNYAPKTLQAIALVNAGLDPKEALKAVNYKHDIRPETVSRFKQKVKKYSLTAPAMVKLAHNAVKDCLTDQPIINTKRDKDGNEITEAISPTWSNKIAAASMVYDRVEPVIHKAESVSHHVIHPVDLSRYRNDELSTGSAIAEVIDISAT